MRISLVAIFILLFLGCSKKTEPKSAETDFNKEPTPTAATPPDTVVAATKNLVEETPKEMLDRFRPYAKSIEPKLALEMQARISSPDNKCTVECVLNSVDIKKTDSLINPVVAVAEYHFKAFNNSHLSISFEYHIRFSSNQGNWIVVGGTHKTVYPPNLQDEQSEINGGIIDSLNSFLK